jgi:hypothetical protein
MSKYKGTRHVCNLQWIEITAFKFEVGKGNQLT